MVAKTEAGYTIEAGNAQWQQENLPIPIRQPLFSARMVAETMPGFDPQLPHQSWNLISKDQSGYPLKIKITNKREETEAVIDEIGGRKTTLKVTESPTKALYEVREEGFRKSGDKDFCAGIILTFSGKFWIEVNGMGILNQITDASTAPHRSRENIANIPRQETAEFDKWVKISRSFKKLEEALSQARLQEIGQQPRLF